MSTTQRPARGNVRPPLAYRDDTFLDGNEARPLRILAEYLQIVNFPALVRHGMISPEDPDLFRLVDDPATALAVLQAGLAGEMAEASPAFARSVTAEKAPRRPGRRTLPDARRRTR